MFADVRRRPGNYGLDGTFREASAFVNGCDAGNSWGLLIGFREWLALKLGCEANLTWAGLILKLANVDASLRPSVSNLSATEDERAVEVLFAELDEFLSARKGASDVGRILEKYLRQNS